MPVPTYDGNHVQEGNDLLIDRYKNTKVVAGMVKARMIRVQAYEDAIAGFLYGIVLDNHPLPGGPWDVLDKLGKIVGEPRNGRTDAQYVPAIRLRIRINRSNGLAEDIIQIAALLAPNAVYRELGGPMAFDVQVLSLNDANVVATLVSALGEARAGTSSGQLRTSTLAATSLVTPGSTNVPGSGIGFSSTRDLPPTKAFASSLGMP